MFVTSSVLCCNGREFYVWAKSCLRTPTCLWVFFYGIYKCMLQLRYLCNKCTVVIYILNSTKHVYVYDTIFNIRLVQCHLIINLYIHT